jgi:hypothetical protein
VPIPWESSSPAFGFSPTGDAWLPQPDDWSDYARDAQEGVEGSTLELYRQLLRLRREHDLGMGDLEWLTGYDQAVVAFTNGGVTVVANTGQVPVELPVGTVIAASGPVALVARPIHNRQSPSAPMRRGALSCAVTEDQFALASSQENGSTTTPSRWISRCRWAPVDAPVEPTSPTRSPTLTVWPTESGLEPPIMWA